jgi:AcrR family transcriptional regulator
VLASHLQEVPVVETKPRRRQARGERRILQLLDAAADVFATEGYSAATTNGIAAAAGVSPGTLYQFFPNKESMADGLADRYVEALTAAHSKAVDIDLMAVPLDDVIDRMLEPTIEIALAEPGFQPLFCWAERLPPPARRLHDAVITRVDRLLTYRVPEMDPRRRGLIASVTVKTFAVLLPMILTTTGRERSEATVELKRILRAYLLDLSD